MTGTDRERDLLVYIAESISRIEEYIAPGKAMFLTTPIVQDAVLRRLETLADATNQLSGDLKSRHPSIPWRLIYRFRNVAAHGYVSIDYQRVWATLTHDLGPLKIAVDSELAAAREDTSAVKE